jgi:hypothetical protein
MTMLVQIRVASEHTTYAVAIEQRDMVTAMSAHPGHYVIDDRVASTIASWYHAPGDCCTNITALSHGMPFDTQALLQEIEQEIRPIDAKDAAVLTHWADALEARETHADYLRRG